MLLVVKHLPQKANLNQKWKTLKIRNYRKTNPNLTENKSEPKPLPNLHQLKNNLKLFRLLWKRQWCALVVMARLKKMQIAANLHNRKPRSKSQLKVKLLSNKFKSRQRLMLKSRCNLNRQIVKMRNGNRRGNVMQKHLKSRRNLWLSRRGSLRNLSRQMEILVHKVLVALRSKTSL